MYFKGVRQNLTYNKQRKRNRNGQNKANRIFKKTPTGERKGKIWLRTQTKNGRPRPLKHSIFTGINFFKNWLSTCLSTEKWIHYLKYMKNSKIKNFNIGNIDCFKRYFNTQKEKITLAVIRIICMVSRNFTIQLHNMNFGCHCEHLQTNNLFFLVYRTIRRGWFLLIPVLLKKKIISKTHVKITAQYELLHHRVMIRHSNLSVKTA